jgi:hypothetical protein
MFVLTNMRSDADPEDDEEASDKASIDQESLRESQRSMRTCLIALNVELKQREETQKKVQYSIEQTNLHILTFTSIRPTI